MNILKIAFGVIVFFASSFALAFNEEDYKRNPQDYFFVGPSSIVGNPGLGLYAKKAIPEGVALPHPYPGNKISSADYDKLLDVLVELTTKYDGNKNLPIDHPTVKADLTRLYENYGIVVKVVHPVGVDKKWQAGLGANIAGGAPMINWDNLHDQFISYAFDISGRAGKALTIYWPAYAHTGDIVFDYQALENIALIVNEPPVNDFINLYTLKRQQNSVSLIPNEDKRSSKLHFVTTREIEAGDELFVSYGPSYTENRKRLGYNVNMSKRNGCGMYDLVKKYFSEMNKRTYDKSVQLIPFLNEEDNKELIEFFEGIINYEQSPVVVMAELNADALAWFSQRLGDDYPVRYNEAKKQLQGIPAPVAAARAPRSIVLKLGGEKLQIAATPPKSPIVLNLVSDDEEEPEEGLVPMELGAAHGELSPELSREVDVPEPMELGAAKEASSPEVPRTEPAPLRPPPSRQEFVAFWSAYISGAPYTDEDRARMLSFVTNPN